MDQGSPRLHLRVSRWVWERDGGRLDLLFTDMVMPEGLSGLELPKRLRHIRQGLRTIIARGYNEETVVTADTSEVTYLPPRRSASVCSRQCGGPPRIRKQRAATSMGAFPHNPRSPRRPNPRAG